MGLPPESSKRIGPAHNSVEGPFKSILAVRCPTASGPPHTLDQQLSPKPQDASENQDEEETEIILYAISAFVASLEGQVCALTGDALVLLDDANSFWWLVRSVKTGELGFIPAENTEVCLGRESG